MVKTLQVIPALILGQLTETCSELSWGFGVIDFAKNRPVGKPCEENNAAKKAPAS